MSSDNKGQGFGAQLNPNATGFTPGPMNGLPNPQLHHHQPPQQQQQQQQGTPNGKRNNNNNNNNNQNNNPNNNNNKNNPNANIIHQPFHPHPYPMTSQFPHPYDQPQFGYPMPHPQYPFLPPQQFDSSIQQNLQPQYYYPPPQFDQQQQQQQQQQQRPPPTMVPMPFPHQYQPFYPQQPPQGMGVNPQQFPPMSHPQAPENAPNFPPGLLSAPPVVQQQQPLSLVNNNNNNNQPIQPHSQQLNLSKPPQHQPEQFTTHNNDQALQSTPRYPLDAMYRCNSIINNLGITPEHEELTHQSLASFISKLDQQDPHIRTLFDNLYQNSSSPLPALFTSLPHDLLNKHAMRYWSENKQDDDVYDQSSNFDQTRSSRKPPQGSINTNTNPRGTGNRSQDVNSQLDHASAALFDWSDDDDDALFDGEKVSQSYLDKYEKSENNNNNKERQAKYTSHPGDKINTIGDNNNNNNNDRKPRPQRQPRQQGLSRDAMGSISVTDPPVERPTHNRSNNKDNDVDIIPEDDQLVGEKKDKPSRFISDGSGFSRDMMGRADDTTLPQPREQREYSNKDRSNNSSGTNHDRANNTNKDDRKPRSAKESAAQSIQNARRNMMHKIDPALDWQGQLKQNLQSLFNKLSIAKFSQVSHDVAFHVMAYATLSTADKFITASQLCAQLLYEHSLLNPAFSYTYAFLSNVLSLNLPPSITEEDAAAANAPAGSKPKIDLSTRPHAFKAKLQLSVQQGLTNILHAAIVDGQSIQHPHNSNAPLLTYVAEHDDDEKIRKQDKFIAWVQFFCELYNIGLLGRSHIQECLVKLRLVTDDEFNALATASNGDKVKDYPHNVDLRRISYEALQAWYTLLQHSGYTLDKEYPHVAALIFKRCQALSDHKPLTPLFRFKLKDILDLRRDGWKAAASRQKIDARMTPESIKMYEITEKVGAEGHQKNIQEKKSKINKDKSAPVHTSALHKLDSAGQVVTAPVANKSIFSRFLNKTATTPTVPVTAPVQTTTTTVPSQAGTSTVVPPPEDKISTDKWIPNSSSSVDHFNSQLILDFCQLSARHWEPIRNSLRASISDFNSQKDVGEINYSFVSIINKPQYLALFDDYTKIAQPNNRTQPERRVPALQVAQIHLPIFFVITFIMHCFQTRQTYDLAHLLNQIIYKYASLVQYDPSHKINESISLDSITTKCREMFIVDWNHVIIALTVGIMANINDIAQDYPRAPQLLPELLAIWSVYQPTGKLLDQGISTNPTNISFTFIQIFTPLIIQHFATHKDNYDQFINTFKTTWANIEQTNKMVCLPSPPSTPLSLTPENVNTMYQAMIKYEYRPIAAVRSALLVQLDAFALFINHSFYKNPRLFFSSQSAYDTNPITPSGKPHTLPLPPISLQYAMSQLMLSYSVALLSLKDSPRKVPSASAGEPILSQLLHHSFFSYSFSQLPSNFDGNDEPVLVKMYMALKKSHNIADIPEQYAPLLESLRPAFNAPLNTPPHAIMTQVMARQLSSKPEPASISNNCTIVTAIISFSKALLEKMKL